MSTTKEANGVIYAIANQKGGVGKTTTTLNLGAALHERGRRVLLVDWDPQASLTVALGINPESVEQTIYDALMASARDEQSPRLEDIIVPTKVGPDVAPANIDLSQAELSLYHAQLGELILADLLEPARRRYDYILIDCLPSLGILTVNALAAASTVMIPMQTEYLAMKGVGLLLKSIQTVKRINKHLHVGGVLLTMADTRTVHSRDVIASTRETLRLAQVPIYSSIIKSNVRLKEAPIVAQSVLAYDTTANVSLAYRQLAEEVEQESMQAASTASAPKTISRNRE
jgi:chromosome partitioning protein